MEEAMPIQDGQDEEHVLILEIRKAAGGERVFHPLGMSQFRGYIHPFFLREKRVAGVRQFLPGNLHSGSPQNRVVQ